MKTAALVFAIPAILLAGDFWKDKKPADWSEKDARKMTTNSPWAHESTPRIEGMMQSGALPSGGRGGRGGGGGMPSAEMGGGDMGGGGRGGMGGGGMGGGGTQQSLPNVKVRWDSAAPVRAAFDHLDAPNPFPKELAEKAAGYYVITVEGLRVPMGRPQGARGGQQAGQQRQQSDTQTLTKEDLQRLQDRMLQAATIVRKDKEPMKPEGVRLMPGARGPSFQLFFKKTDPIVVSEKEVKLVVKMGPMVVESKFKPKDMVFDGQLAL